MPKECQRFTSGGKGNRRMFNERDPNVCAAGIPSAQADEDIRGALQHYLLKDEVDALIGDAIVPPPEPKPLPPLRHPIPLDNRHGIYTELYKLIHPDDKTKFQSLVDDFKDTIYSSYWKKALGHGPDPVPMFPEGYNIEGTTYGKETPYHGRLYDLVMPKETRPGQTPKSWEAGIQTRRNFCSPPFNPDAIFGHKTSVDKRGKYAKTCLTDEKITYGTPNHCVVSSIQSNFQHVHQPRAGSVLAPNNNIYSVPKGYSFGFLKPPDNLPECLTLCGLNPKRDEFKKCLKGLNTLRKVLKTRFLPTFFRNFYLNLKYFDKNKTGWIPKDVVYKYCGSLFIRFDPALIEPLLEIWSAFDGVYIEYKTFVHVLNYREPFPEMCKVPDMPGDCLDYETTYREMVKPDKEPDLSPMAGVPSGRYLDMDFPVTPKFCCTAHRTCLPEESDMKSCINPSVLTQLFVSHRDMYAKREPQVVRRVFEAAYGKFTDKQFDTYWEAAKKLHCQELVSYETFRRALENIHNPGPEIKNKKGAPLIS